MSWTRESRLLRKRIYLSDIRYSFNVSISTPTQKKGIGVTYSPFQALTYGKGFPLFYGLTYGTDYPLFPVPIYGSGCPLKKGVKTMAFAYFHTADYSAL